MYKKIIALCLSVAIVMSTAIMPIFADNSDKKGNNKPNNVLKHFTDSDIQDWAEKSIEKLGALGIINGMGNGFFKPNNNVTHIEAIAMVLRLTGQEDKAKGIDKQPEFFNGLSDKWGWGYLQLALEEGIIIPAEDGKFDPKTPAKRHEIAKYIVRALGKTEEAKHNMNAKLSFKDANAIPKASVGYVYVINKLGIMQGNNNVFQPNKPITRAEMAVLLDRAENGFEDSIVDNNTIEGVFVAYDEHNHQMTLNVNGRQVVYNVNPYAPVYKNNTYDFLTELNPGDIVEVIVDNNVIIFVELKETGTVPPTGQTLSIRHIDYNSLPAELQDRIDTLKLTENYAAFKIGNYVYLIAARGQMSSGGYNITMANVYREATQTGKYNLKVVVETYNPANSVVTQSVTYPYDVVRLSYFSGISKVMFVNKANSLLEETTLGSIEADDVISGIIKSIDEDRRIIRLTKSDNSEASYFIPENVQIVINNTLSSFSALEPNMTAEITRTNGVISRLVAENDDNIVVINGRITDVDTVGRIVTLLESDGDEKDYSIPRTAQITLNNRTAYISDLQNGMTAAITKTDGVITKLAAQNVTNSTEVINGKITDIDTDNKTVKIKQSNNEEKTYYIPSTVIITLNTRKVPLSDLTVNMTVALTRVNGAITRLAATQITETINGNVYSVNETNNELTVIDSHSVKATYDIPEDTQILLDNQAAELSDLVKGMTVVVTRVDSIVTKLVARNDIQLVEGLLQDIHTGTNSSNIDVKIGSSYKTYVITPETAVFYYGVSSQIQSIPINSTITIKSVNGIVTEVRNK